MLRLGDRVATHRATDAWMRHGVVVRLTRTRAHVRLDRSGRTLRFTFDNVTTTD